MGLSKATAIVGLGTTEYTRYSSGRSGTALAAEAIQRALDDAGLRPQDIDGIAHYVTDTSHLGGRAGDHPGHPQPHLHKRRGMGRGGWPRHRGPRRGGHHGRPGHHRRLLPRTA